MQLTTTTRYAKRIAIDGPAGSGKSTLGSQLAARLNYVFIDAGLIYRAITQALLQGAVSVPELITDEAACVQAARSLRFDLTTILDQRPQLLLNDAVLDEASLHTTIINQSVPVVAAHGQVRVVVREIQRQIAQRDGIVFAGRDIGTVVLPDAEVKIYLDVSLDERADRRYLRAKQGDPLINREIILTDLRTRDHHDTSRAESPLQIAHDAVIIKGDDLSIDEVLNVALRCATL